MPVSLNPCFSGTYSRRARLSAQMPILLGLNPCFSGTYSRRALTWHRILEKDVLILVLVEHTLGDIVL